MRFTLRQLEIFAGVVRTGQVRRAADRLHLSQAAVSQALRELADALETPLFERRGRELVPTPEARKLLSLSSGPLASLERLAEQLSGESGPLSGSIRVAASSTPARYLLPWAFAVLRRRYPALRLTLVSGNSVFAERRVADMEADIGFIEGPSGHGDIEAVGWRTDALQVIAPRDYPASGIDLADLAAHHWVAREVGSGTRTVFEQSLALAGVAAPRAALVLDDSEAVVRAVAAGAGLACVSRLAAEDALAARRVRLVPLKGLTLTRPLWQVRRNIGVVSPLVERFVSELDTVLLDKPL